MTATAVDSIYDEREKEIERQTETEWGRRI